MDLTEADDIKRWQEYTEELYTKNLPAMKETPVLFLGKEDPLEKG